VKKITLKTNYFQIEISILTTDPAAKSTLLSWHHNQGNLVHRHQPSGCSDLPSGIL